MDPAAFDLPNGRSVMCTAAGHIFSPTLDGWFIFVSLRFTGPLRIMTGLSAISELCRRRHDDGSTRLAGGVGTARMRDYPLGGALFEARVLLFEMAAGQLASMSPGRPVVSGACWSRCDAPGLCRTTLHRSQLRVRGSVVPTGKMSRRTKRRERIAARQKTIDFASSPFLDTTSAEPGYSWTIHQHVSFSVEGCISARTDRPTGACAIAADRQAALITVGRLIARGNVPRSWRLSSLIGWGLHQRRLWLTRWTQTIVSGTSLPSK